MKAGRGVRDIGDPYLRGQDRVQAARERGRLMAARELDARHLPERVNAGIGSAGAVHRDGGAFEASQRVLQQPLDRHAARLPLPPDKPRAAVADRQLERACHRSFRT